MKTEQNKALVRRLMEEVMSNGNMSLIDELVAPDFIENEVMPGASSGREGFKQTNLMLRSAFPDLKVTINDMLAEGDKVALSVTFSGTHKGDLMVGVSFFL
jgi:predicted ester cyclase